MSYSGGYADTDSRETKMYRTVLTMTEQSRMERIFRTGKSYSSEKCATFSNPIKAQGEMTAVRRICAKAVEPSVYSGS